MSYCRWSSICENNYESDLYIFDHYNGHITVNVAARRLAGIENAPRIAVAPDDYGKAYVAAYLARRRWRDDNKDKLTHVPLDLKYAGQSFDFQEPEDCVAFLRELKELGYNMPERVLDVGIYEDGP